MWRIQHRDGNLSDMFNKTWAIENMFLDAEIEGHTAIKNISGTTLPDPFPKRTSEA